MNKNYVLGVLEGNGINKEYLGKNNWIELGSEEWMNMCSEVVGKDSYESENWSEEDYSKCREFRRIIEEELGIECY